MSEEFELRSAFVFEAAHHLPAVPRDHRCRRVHGHSYTVEVRVCGALAEPYGWVIDLGTIEARCERLRNELDHRLLNDIPGLENPTSEMLARWVWQQLIGELPGMTAVLVRETQNSACVYRGGAAAS
jgi:6-pyruvoyltetrahydropterin/6-carboxytetrahydropterin synthase